MTDVFQPLEALEAYFAGEIEPDEARQLRDWIESDPRRLEEVAELAKLHGHLMATGVRPLTENVMSSLAFQEQIDRVKQRRAEHARRRWATVGGAALAVGLLAVVAGYSQPRSPRSASADEDEHLNAKRQDP